MSDTKASRSHSDAIADRVASRVVQQISESSRPLHGAAKQHCEAMSRPSRGPAKGTQRSKPSSGGGLFKTLRKGIGFATKLAWLQATQGPDAVSEELLDQLDTFVQKVKSSGKVKNTLASGLYGELEELTKDIRIKKREYERDQRGRFSSKVSRESDDYFV